MKILLPVDGSEFTKRMLAYVVERDELLGKAHEYIAFTVVPPLPAHSSRFLDEATIRSFYDEGAEQVLDPVRRFAAQQALNLRCESRVGHAADTIAEFARAEKPDLIVMGSHGHGAVGSAFLGSVAVGVLSRCRVPVLLIR